FYPQNVPPEFNLTTFDVEDIILVTGKFHVIEYVNEKNEKLPALKVIMNDLVHFDMDLNNIPKFPVLTNMTAVVQEPPRVTNDDVIMIIAMTDHKTDQPNPISSSVIKPLSKESKPYTRTKDYHKLADLAKEALTNSSEPDASLSTSADIQPE
ncbi:592_t:CDS:2, partial [Racocetra persica]